MHDFERLCFVTGSGDFLLSDLLYIYYYTNAMNDGKCKHIIAKDDYVCF